MVTLTDVPENRATHGVAPTPTEEMVRIGSSRILVYDGRKYISDRFASPLLVSRLSRELRNPMARLRSLRKRSEAHSFGWLLLTSFGCLRWF